MPFLSDRLVISTYILFTNPSFPIAFRPLEIVPSVGNDGGGPKAKRLLELLRPTPQRQTQLTITGMFGRSSTLKPSDDLKS